MLPVLVLFALQSTLCSAFSTNVIGHYPYYGGATLPADQIPYSKLTHLIYGFLGSDSQCTLVGTGGLSTIQSKLASYPSLRAMFAIGGVGNSTGFRTVAYTNTARISYVGKCLARMRSYGFHGIDIDWEFAKSSTDRTKYGLLLREFRRQMTSSELLSVEAPPNNWYGQWLPSADFSTLNFISVLSYDFVGSWSPINGHHANLFHGTGQEEDGNSVKDAFLYWRDTRHQSASKIALGLPFYGKMFNTPNREPYKPYTSYTQIVPFSTLNVSYTAAQGYTRYYDSLAKAPYLYNAQLGNWITYNDLKSLMATRDWAIARGAYGVMIWEISQEPTNTFVKALAA